MEPIPVKYILSTIKQTHTSKYLLALTNCCAAVPTYNEACTVQCDPLPNHLFHND